MVGYEMGFLPNMVYTTTKTSLVENLKHGIKSDIAGQHGNTFCYKNSPEVKFLRQPQTLMQETWPLENFDLRF